MGSHRALATVTGCDSRPLRPGRHSMKPPAFDYVRIDSVDEALSLLAAHGDDARILAGGQSLMPILNMRLAQPSILLDITRCDALRPVGSNGGHLVVGAAATQAEVEWRPSLPDEVPLLAHAFPHISHFQIRNRGTVCGSLAHADPSAELPLCLAVLEGGVTLRSSRGERTVTADRFFRGMLQTDRRSDELMVSARFPLRQAGNGYAFEEFSLRHGDYAVVAAAAAVTPEGIRLGIGGVADRPEVARWPGLDGTDLEDAINDFAWSLDARDDAQASAKVRRHLVRELGHRVVARARQAVEARP